MDRPSGRDLDERLSALIEGVIVGLVEEILPIDLQTGVGR